MRRLRPLPIVLFTVLVALASISSAQPKSAQPKSAQPKNAAAKGEKTAVVAAKNGIKLVKPSTQRWQVGVVVSARGGACVDMFATLPVPTDWPEQKVRVVDEDVSSFARISYRVLENGVKQMLVTIPQLPYGQTAKVLITFEVERSQILAPTDPNQFSIPTRLPKEISKFLAPSPFIESRHPEILKVAKQAIADQETAWEKVEAIYDWVRKHVDYQNGELKGALAALRDKTGDCEEMTSLFIAMCRANKIPARTVWIPDHCYPEFYLVDQDGVGHWFPCQAAGVRDFGNMPDTRPVLQKGDNYTVPEKKGAQRYVAEFLTGKPAQNGGRPPQHEFVRKLLPTPAQ